MSDLGIEQTKKLSDAEVELKREVVNKVMLSYRFDLSLSHFLTFHDVR